MSNINRKMKTLRKSQRNVLEIKKNVMEMKKAFHRHINIFKPAKGKISELKDKKIQNSHNIM